MSESNIIIGDFNIATNLPNNHSKSLLNIMSSSNFNLHNTYPTNKYGNILDLLISHKSFNLKTLPSFPPNTLSSTFDDYFNQKLTNTLSNFKLTHLMYLKSLPYQT